MQVIPNNESYTITSKGQVTIPFILRKKLNIKTGDQVSFILDKNEIKINHIKNPLINIFGSVKPLKKGISFNNMRKIALEEKANAIH